MNLKVEKMLQAEWAKCRQNQLKEKSQKWSQKIKSGLKKSEVNVARTGKISAALDLWDPKASKN